MVASLRKHHATQHLFEEAVTRTCQHLVDVSPQVHEVAVILTERVTGITADYMNELDERQNWGEEPPTERDAVERLQHSAWWSTYNRILGTITLRAASETFGERFPTGDGSAIQ